MDNMIQKAAELVDNVLAQPDGSRLFYLASIYYQLAECEPEPELTNEELLKLTERLADVAAGASVVPLLTAERTDAVRFLLENGISPNMSPELTTITADQARTLLLTCDPDLFGDLIDAVAVDSQEYYGPETGNMNTAFYESINNKIAESLSGSSEEKNHLDKSKWFIEVVQDFDGKYYANMIIGGKPVTGLPEHVDYNTLREAIRRQTGIVILPRKDMRFEAFQRKKYAYIDATQERPDCRVSLQEIKAGWQPNFGSVQSVTANNQSTQAKDVSTGKKSLSDQIRSATHRVEKSLPGAQAPEKETGR